MEIKAMKKALELIHREGLKKTMQNYAFLQSALLILVIS